MFRFVLLGAPRTGSSMLQERLCSLPDVLCLPALFSRKGWPTPNDPRNHHKDRQCIARLPSAWTDFEARISHPASLLKAIESASHWRTIGFKHHITSNDPGLTPSILQIPSVARLVLTRNNMLAAYSSNLIANETGQGLALRGIHNLKSKKVCFDRHDFQIFIKRRTKSYEKWNSLISEQANMSIDYEEACTESGVQRICSFLGTEYKLGTVSTLQRNSSDILSRFINPDSARKYLADIGRSTWENEDIGRVGAKS